ncbi:MAG TPA: YceI family protein [Terriglobales bacterium]|nr:YceI family protein [Terriglobales bacterium]
MMRCIRAIAIVVVAFACCCPLAGARDIDTEKSVLTVRVYKSGLFSAFAHDHEIRTPIQSGSFDEQKHTVEFKVKSADLKVLDPDGSDSERSQVQHTMEGPKVLDPDKFPEISFHSTSIEVAGPGKWNVQGDLTLHGQTHPVKVEVEGANGHYRGSSRFRQTEFGMTPITIGGGSIKVKDEVRIEFDVADK